MRRQLASIILSLALSVPTFATPKDVVSLFGQYLSSWCNTDDVQYRDRIERLCSGVKSCRVEDKVHADYQRKRGYMDYETYFLDSYLNMFQTLIPTGVKYSLSNIVVETQDQYPNGQVLTFITADVKVSGKINQTSKDLFLVRDDKISGIYTYSSIYGFKHLNGNLMKYLQNNHYRIREYGPNNILIAKGPHQVGLIYIDERVLIPFKWDRILHEGSFVFGVKGYEDPLSPSINWWDEQSDIYDLRTGRTTSLEGFHYEIDYSNFHPMLLHQQLPRNVFNDGYAVVYKTVNGVRKFGYLSENDLTYDVKFIYDEASYFQNGLARVRIGDSSMLVDKQLNVVLKLISDYEIVDDWYFNNGQIIIRNKQTKTEGVINLKGEWVIQCDKYSEISPLYCGRARVYSKTNETYGFIDSDGTMAIPFIFDDANKFLNGVCLAGRWPDEYELINTSGTNLIPNMKFAFHVPHDKKAEQWGNNIIILENTEGKYGIVNNKGQTYYGFKWVHDYLHYFNDNLIAYGRGEKYGFMNIYGEEVVPAIYDELRYSFDDRYCCVCKIINGKKKYGCLNENGILIVPCIYDDAFNFSNGISFVEQDDKQGIIDVYGNAYFW